MRAHRDELIQRGILPPDPPTPSPTASSSASSSLPSIPGKRFPMFLSRRVKSDAGRATRPLGGARAAPARCATVAGSLARISRITLIGACVAGNGRAHIQSALK